MPKNLSFLLYAGIHPSAPSQQRNPRNGSIHVELGLCLIVTVELNCLTSLNRPGCLLSIFSLHNRYGDYPMTSQAMAMEEVHPVPSMRINPQQLGLG
jgi:hypothetical protein